MRLHWVIALLLMVVAFASACAPRTKSPSLDSVAERYVKLVLALGQHDPDYVDAYYGPPEWKAEVERDTLSLGSIRASANLLVASIGNDLPANRDEMVALRRRHLRRQLEAVASRARLLSGDTLSFDEESLALYDAVAPPRPDSAFAAPIAALEALLPGAGPLEARLERFRANFVIPPARLDAVFQAAIAEARRRTRAHLTLPDSESFVVEYVRNQPWSGYNWYQGNARSRIEINVDLPIFIDRALDLACHEGYPGHHVYGTLLEQHLARERGWQEFTVSPLYSPQSMIGEGTAVVAPEVAFPGAERAAFEKRVLFPLAGLDTALYDRFDRVRRASEGLEWAGIERSRRMVDHRMTHAQGLAWAMRYEARSRPRAEHALAFTKRYRSYVVNYPLGRDLVLKWLRANGGDESHPGKRWELYLKLLASPRLPRDLMANR